MIKRQTRQKMLVEDQIRRMNSFFDAEDLYRSVFEKDRSIGIATVYRCLNRLTADGAIHSYQCSRKTVYSKMNGSHCHFTCKRCHERKHITIKALDFLQKEIAGDICHFQIDVTGICSKCKKLSEASKHHPIRKGM
jgi:Fur family transcriptional regulator, ferric uptake regulator